MLARVDSTAILGIDAYIVEVEVDVSRGMRLFTIVGLPDAAVQESKERVQAAIKNSGFEFPAQRLTINLAPADVRKEGPAFDLPIALGLLAATGQVKPDQLGRYLILGELSLDGSVRPVSGVLPAALRARAAGRERLLVPAENAREAAVVEGIEVCPVNSLYEAVQLLNGEGESPIIVGEASCLDLSAPDYEVDFSEVKGQEHVKRALEVAAAGGHNILASGPPGAGKTMLARRLPTILPPLTLEEALEVTKLYSISGLLSRETALVTTRPFRSPHHTISNAGLVGGGSIPRPGEISLAHHGVLFLDELPEFRRDVLEVLRQPLEDGVVTIARAASSLTYPARFTLVAAMNPCPCGYYGDSGRECSCSSGQIRRYLMRISGPLLDRIDIHIEVPRLRQEELVEAPLGEPSAAIRARVMRARARQQERFAGRGFFCNAHMRPKDLRAFCPVEEEARNLLRTAIAQLSLSGRAYDRILKLARTIADLEGQEEIQVPHVAEAIQYRSLDRKLWG